MTYIDDYVNRVNNSGGTIAGSFESNTKNTILNNFANSPYYREISIENNQGIVSNNVGVRIVKTNKSNKREVLFKPDASFSIGDIAIVGSDKWILTDFIPDSIFPKAIAELCNTTIKWVDDSNVTQEYPCIVETKTLSTDDEKYIVLPNGYINVSLQYNDITKLIPLDERFVFGKNVYKVEGIDDVTNVHGGKGMLNIRMSVDAKRESSDDIPNKIADNSSDIDTSGGGLLF